MIKKSITLCAAVSLMTLSASAQRQRTMTRQDSLIMQYQADGKTPEGLKTVKGHINKLANAGNENDLMLAIRAANAISQSALADSLHKVALARYPEGHAAMIAGYNSIINAHAGSAQALAMYQAWIKKFPEPAINEDIVYDYARSELAGAYANEGDVKSSNLWTSRVKNASYRSVVQMSNANTFLMKKDTANAAAMMIEGLKTAKASMDNSADPGAKSSYYTYLRSYATLLYKQGKKQQAMETITEAYHNSPNKSIDLKESYGVILTANGKGKEVLPILADVIKSGKGSKAAVAALKTAYIQSNGSANGYDSYLTSLTDFVKKEMQARLAKDMIKQPASSFKLSDLNGNSVSLADLKGKVVILDFWATWCGPCKRSFPAMQMALNKYKADPNVKFLFIDTWERNDNPKPAVKSFITENKYSFTVLLDNAKTKVVDNYGISAIPAKFIIDGNGQIRFKLTGFSGGDDAAVEELSAMIEAAKKSAE